MYFYLSVHKAPKFLKIKFAWKICHLIFLKPICPIRRISL